MFYGRWRKTKVLIHRKGFIVVRREKGASEGVSWPLDVGGSEDYVKGYDENQGWIGGVKGYGQ